MMVKVASNFGIALPKLVPVSAITELLLDARDQETFTTNWVCGQIDFMARSGSPTSESVVGDRCRKTWNDWLNKSRRTKRCAAHTTLPIAGAGSWPRRRLRS